MKQAIVDKKWRSAATPLRSPDQMGRNRTKTKEGDPVNLGFRAPAELIDAIDEEAKHMATASKGMKVSRTQAAIVLLWEALEARAKVRGTK